MRYSKAILILALAVGLRPNGASAADAPSDKPADSVAALQEASTLLVGIRDKKTAEAAKDKLIEAGKKIKANAAAREKMYPGMKGLTKEEQESLAKATLTLEVALAAAEKIDGAADTVKAFKDAVGSKGGADDLAAMMAAMNEAIKLLEGIKDKKTADDAKDKLVAAGKKIKANSEVLQGKFAKIEDLPKEDKQKVEGVMMKFLGEMLRLSTIPDAQDTLKAFSEAMTPAK